MDLKILENSPPWEWPGDATETLLEVLRDSEHEESDRLIAADLAGDYAVVNDDVVRVLLSVLSDSQETDELRGRAAISLGPALESAEMEGFDDPEDAVISEQIFHEIQKSLHRLYMDAVVPKEVRRSVLEASVRASEDWHQDAVRGAYESNDEDWKLTAVFAMRWVRGFDKQILEALESESEIVRFEAICAAGNWEVAEAWSHVSRIIVSKDPEKALLLAAIEAAASIRPKEAGPLFVDLTNSDDEDIVGAAFEAMTMAEAANLCEDEFDDEDEDFLF